MGKKMAAKKKAKKKSSSIPKTGTKAAENYFKSHISIMRFMNLIFFMASRMDDMSERAHQFLTKHDLAPERENKDPMKTELRNNRQFFLEVILVRHIENFLNYLSELLYEIFTQRPETLKSSEKVELSQVLKFKSIDEFVLSAAERKVENLSYSSFKDLTDFFLEKFNLVLFEEKDMQKVTNAIETRNISVHNRCTINERYCIRTNEDLTKIGEMKELYIGDIDEINELLLKSVKDVDKQTKKKLNLKGIRFNLDSDDKAT